MEPQTLREQTYQGKFSTQLAIASLAIGTLLLALYMAFPGSAEIVIMGIFYLLFAVFANSIVLLNLVYHFVILPNQREYLAIKILILLSNVPVAYAYICFITNNNLY